MKKDATAYPGFSVRNICANGRIADKEGNIRDLLYGLKSIRLSSVKTE